MRTHGELGARGDLRVAAVTIDVAALKQACLGFHAEFPRRSAKRVLHVTQSLWLALLGYALVWALETNLELTARLAYALAFIVFAAAILWRLVAASRLTSPLSRLAAPAHWPVYTVLCPLYHEADVVPDLVAALDHIDYPSVFLDIKLLVEADDVDTIAAALAVARSPHMEVVLIPSAAPRTKPKALNVGLARARGAYVVVYDAEDRPHPQQLRAALAAFEDDAELACVQAPLVIDNASANWLSRQFAAEYAIQFRQILPLLAALHLPLPLGGSSNHFRTTALRASGGWDPFNVTEDADLGYRLARDGLRAGTIMPPTYEEAPVTWRAWHAQRTRWIKGHLQTWLVLMRNPIRAAREMGLGAFASLQLVLGGGLAAAFVHGPMALIVMIAAVSPYRILTPLDFGLALVGYAVAALAALTATALSGDISHIRAAPTMPFYWPLASLAAYHALLELIVRPHHWAKTGHGASMRGTPRSAVTDAAAESVRAAA